MVEWQDTKDLERVVLLLLKVFILFGGLFCCSEDYNDFELVCYAKNQLPRGKSLIHQHYLLDQMDWGKLPIDSLWPLIEARDELKLMLPQHCNQLEYGQLLWIAQNDPAGMNRLLVDSACAQMIDWRPLESHDYSKYFSSLKIYDISCLSYFSLETFRIGLQNIDFYFPSPLHLTRFLSRLFETNTDILSLTSGEIFAFDLFDLDVLSELIFEGRLSQHDVKSLLDLLLTEAPSRLKNYPLKDTPRYREALAAYSLKLKEFVAFLQSPTISLTEIFKYASLAEQLSNDFPLLTPLAAPAIWKRHKRLLVSEALVTKNCHFFVENVDLVIDYYKSHSLGYLHQRQLLHLCLSSSTTELTAKYHEAGIIGGEAITDAMTYSRAFKQKLVELGGINCRLLLTLSLLPRPRNLKLTPISVPQLSQTSHFNTLLEASRLVLAQKDTFVLSSFAVKFTFDAVIDMGGPLLDWIHQVLNGMLRYSLFKCDSQVGYARPAPFLPLQWFLVLGLLQGKLLQMNCQLPWTLNREFGFEEAKLMHYLDPDEAVTLQIFNEAGFCRHRLQWNLASAPELLNCPNAVFASCQAEVEAYFVEQRQTFESWKQQALEFYRLGLEHSLRPGIDEAALSRLLQPATIINVQELTKAFNFICKSELDCFDLLKEAWSDVFYSLTNEELIQFLLFATGQTSLMFNTLQINVIFLSVAQKRLPRADTCHSDIFIFVPMSLMESPEAALHSHFRTSLLTAICNYEGFGHS